MFEGYNTTPLNFQVGDSIKVHEIQDRPVAILNIKDGILSGWGVQVMGGNLTYNNGILSWQNTSGVLDYSAYICKLN